MYRWVVHERRNSSALAMEIRLSCTKPSIWCVCHSFLEVLSSSPSLSDSYHSPLRRCSLAGVHSSSLPSSLVLRCRRGARAVIAGTDLDLTTFWVMNSGFFTARPEMYGTQHIQHKTDDSLILANMYRGDQLPMVSRIQWFKWFYSRKYNQLHRRCVVCYD